MTSLQAKIFLTLSRFGKAATNKAISQAANLARQEVNRVTKELFNKGLIEEIVRTPREYKAIPLEQAINILHNNKSKENTEAYNKAMLMLKRHQKRLDFAETCEEQEKFIMVPAFETHYRRFYESLGKAQESIESMISFDSIIRAISDENEPHKKALKRNIKMRYITEKPKDEAKASKIIMSLKKAGDFRIGYIDKLPSLFFGIVDNREIFMVISPSRIATDSQCLWSNSHGIIEIFRGYFEAKWRIAEESPC